MSDPVRTLLQNPVVVYTVCILVLLLFLALFVSITGSNLQSLTRGIGGLFSAAAKELSLKGGRVAKVNALLSLVLAFVFVLLVTPNVLGSIRAALSGTPPHDIVQYGLFVVLCLFFVCSMGFVRSDEEYKKKTGRLPAGGASRAAEDQSMRPPKAEPPTTSNR